MRKLLNDISLYLWLCLAAVSLLSSCTSDEGEADDVQTVKIMFTITMGDKASGTRADTWGDTYTSIAATEWESYIHPGALQVFIYNKNDAYLGEVENLTYSRHEDEKNVYDIVGTFSAKISDSDLDADGKLPCKLVVFANCNSYMTEQKAAAGVDAMKNVAYNFDAAGMKAGTTYIPMWGVRTYSSENTEAEYQPLTIDKDTKTDAGTIYMLRSMAKVKVTLNDYMADKYTLSDVSLSNYSYYGYIAPESCGVSDTEKLSHEIVTDEEALTAGTAFQSFHPYSGSNAKLDLDFIEETSGRTYIMYVPEFITTMSDGMTDPCINLTLTNNSTNSPQTYTVPLTNLTNKAQSLVRNTLYTFNITGSGCTLEYQAQNWTDKKTATIKFE